MVSEDDDPPELLIHDPFEGLVKITAFPVVSCSGGNGTGGEGDDETSPPTRVRLFVNRDDLDLTRWPRSSPRRSLRSRAAAAARQRAAGSSTRASPGSLAACTARTSTFPRTAEEATAAAAARPGSTFWALRGRTPRGRRRKKGKDSFPQETRNERNLFLSTSLSFLSLSLVIHLHRLSLSIPLSVIHSLKVIITA